MYAQGHGRLTAPGAPPRGGAPGHLTEMSVTLSPSCRWEGFAPGALQGSVVVRDTAGSVRRQPSPSGGGSAQWSYPLQRHPPRIAIGLRFSKAHRLI